MRKLINEDFFLISEIADKMDFTLPPSTKYVGGKEANKTQAEYGTEIMTLLLKKAYKAQEPINQLLSNVMEKELKEIEALSIMETVKSMTELFKQEGFIDFFK